jgi:hypothetical protein
MPFHGDRGAGKLSKATVIKNLKQEYEVKQAEYDKLMQENILLRTREVRPPKNAGVLSDAGRIVNTCCVAYAGGPSAAGHAAGR